MFKPTYYDILFIGLFLEAFLYGIYSGIFAIYLQYRTPKKDTNTTQNIVFYSICCLYVLSAVVFVCDIVSTIYEGFPTRPKELLLRIVFIQGTLFGCCDFIAQFILIYRCWIVWGHNIRVVIIPSILALAFLGTWLAGSNSVYISSDSILLWTPDWGDRIILSALAFSLTVNALVTGLIVFRIFRVFRQVKATSDDHILGATGGSKLRRMIFILIESGIALFSIQLARLAVTIVWTEAAYEAYTIILGIHEMVNGITPTIILVRTSMGLSFHDEKSMEELVTESLHFASNDPNSVPDSEKESIGIVDQHNRGDGIGVQPSDDIELVEK